MNSDLVSVIIPTYNAKSTIEKTINSVLNQSYNNFEIICVDDCSTDDTYQKLIHMSYKDKRIKVYRNNDNYKSAYTRNKAIANARGHFIMQVDDDDLCESNRMAIQVEFLKKNLEYSFVGSNCKIFDKNGVYGSINKPEKPVREDFVNTSPFINPSVMFRKSALLDVGAYRVSRETIRGQDYDLFMRLYIKGKIGYNIQNTLVYYYKDQQYYNKIKFMNRLGEFKFRIRNFYHMGLIPKYLPYAFKPLIAAILPNKFLNKYRQYKK